MGTSYRVVVRGQPLSRQEPLGGKVAAALEAVNASMSTYRPDSELSKFNDAPVGTVVEISPSLEAVLDVAEDVSRRSGGVFDVTVGALVDAWGFGPKDVEGAPTDADLERLRAAIGWEKLRRSPGSLTRTSEAVRVDLSAIAKGYGVDEVARVLEEAGVAHYMVEVGGEVRTKGEGRDGQPWRIGVENPNPDDADRTPHKVVRLTGMAMATSGDYRNYREVDGKRVSHTLDPRTGRPVTHGLASVSVIDSRAVVADAWATALTVLGPEEGLAVAEREGLAAYMIVRTESGFETRATAAFSGRILPP